MDTFQIAYPLNGKSTWNRGAPCQVATRAAPARPAGPLAGTINATDETHPSPQKNTKDRTTTFLRNGAPSGAVGS